MQTVDSSVQQFQTCIDACNKCMQACEECLTSKGARCSS